MCDISASIIAHASNLEHAQTLPSKKRGIPCFGVKLCIGVKISSFYEGKAAWDRDVKISLLGEI